MYFEKPRKVSLKNKLIPDYVRYIPQLTLPVLVIQEGNLFSLQIKKITINHCHRRQKINNHSAPIIKDSSGFALS